MVERLIASSSERLLACLRRALPDWKRTTLEQRLRSGCVRVNGETVTRNDLLAPGDEVLVVGLEQGEPSRANPSGIPVLYEDDELIAVDKPTGLLSVSTDMETERTALALVRASLSRPRHKAQLWPVHRLDRETSGVLLFAKSRAAQEAVQANWGEARKLYLALVEGRPRPKDGVVDQPLFEDKQLNVRVGDHPDAKPARTRYATLEARGDRTLLEVELDSGRRHQIRAHLAWLGHPVVGDARYGTKAARMGLHALRLSVAHPSDGRELVIEAPIPAAFATLAR